MKIVFLEDVKGKGKRGEIKEVPTGFGHFLIKDKKAEEATTKVLNRLKREEDEKVEKYTIEKNKAQQLANKLDALKVITKVRVGENGRVFGSVASKQIIENLEHQHKIKLDKHDLHLNHPIQGLGEVDVTVKLHREVTGVIHILVEKE